jgi:uncharacterized membrane protein
MNDFNDTFFGPLGKEYCAWFYFLTVWFFIGLVLIIIPAIFIGITQKKNLEYYIGVLSISIMYLAFYFQNRLLYSMCLR